MRGSVHAVWFWMLALLLCAWAPVGLAEGIKIGFVDLDKALRELPEAQAGAANLNRQIEARQKEIEAKRQQIETFQRNLEKEFPKLSNAQRQEKEAQLQAMVMNLQKYQRKAQDEISMQRNEILEKIQNRLVRVVSQIGESGHYTIILNDKSVLYVNGAIDLTQQVVAAMEKQPAGKGDRK